MKILVTGTHFTPAAVVINEIKRDQDVEVVYVGRKTTREGDKSVSVESQVLPKLRIKFIHIVTGRLQRSFSIYTIPSLLKIPIGFFQAFFILFREKPDVILSFGGYVAVPLVVLGWFFSIPIIVHEQTLVSGLANSFSCLFADKIAVTFDVPYSFPKDKTIVTGNPLRQEVLNPKNPSTEFKKLFVLGLPSILVTGGNQGSHVINETLQYILPELNKKYLIIHQTGDSKFNDFEKLLQVKNKLEFPQRYIVKKWIKTEDFGLLLKNVDLAVSRAGANTLLELAYHGVPAILIPIPYISRDEQNVNAKYFQKFGFVNILPQKSLTSENLLDEINKSFKQLSKMKENAKIARDVVIPNAAPKIALEVLLLGSEKSR